MKRAMILMENIVFIILTLIFLMSLIFFVSNQSSSTKVLEPINAKKIALLIDASKPGEIIKLNFQDLKKISDKNGIDFSKIIQIQGNNVFVKLSKNSESSYSFFNNVEVSAYPDKDDNNNLNGNYVFFIK